MTPFPRLAALSLALLALAGAAHAQAPAPGDVVVNEISYDPPAPQPSTNEWVEVVNRSAAAVDLAGLRIVDAASGTSAAVPGPLVVPPGGFAVLVANGPAFAAAYPGVAFTALASFPTLNNTGDTVRLTLGGADLDAVPYLASWGGTDRSLERRDPAGPSTSAANFGSTTDPAFGTPGRQNSLFAVDTTPPAIDAAEAINATTIDVTFSEPVTSASAQNPANYSVSGGVGTPASATLTSPTVVRLALATPLAGPQGYTVTATGIADAAGNVSGATSGTLFFGSFATPAPRDLVINEVMFDPPPTTSATNEWVELYNRSTQTFDLSTLRFADSASASLIITSTSTPIAPGAYVVIGRDAAAFSAAYPGVPFVQVAGFPTLNNDTDRPAILLPSGTVIDAVPYRVAWGGVDASLERKDPNGPSTSARNFATSTDALRGTPGRQNSVYAPDTVGPTIVSASVSPDGRTVTVVLDEPTANVTAAAFAVSGASVTAAVYDEAALTVTLTLAAPLAGNATVTATGLRDGLGNTTATSSIAVTFTPDATPPGITAVATSATTVRIEFTELVTIASAQAATVALDGGQGAPASVTVETADGFASALIVTLGAPLTERQVYTVTVSGITDRAGNTATAATTRILFGAADTALPGQLVVNEIMYDPQTGDSEYLEVLNTTTDRVFGLRTITLDDGDPTSATPLASTPTLVLPGATAVIVRNGPAFAARFPGVPFTTLSNLSLSNSGEAVVLRAAGVTVDSVFYRTTWHRPELDDATGIALERRDPAGPSNARSNWSSSLDASGGTPGRANTLSIAGPPVERGQAITVTSPFAPDDGQAAQIAYTLDAPAALVRVRVYDGGGRVVREIEDGRLSGATGTVTWDGTGPGGERLRAGIYIVLLEAVDAVGGRTEAHRAAVVLARR